MVFYGSGGEFPLSLSPSRDASGFRDRAARGSASHSASPSAAPRSIPAAEFPAAFERLLGFALVFNKLLLLIKHERVMVED